MNPPAPARGRLFLVPGPLDFGCEPQAALDTVLPAATMAQAARLVHWLCENAKSARAYLKRIDALHPLAAPLGAQHIVELPREMHKKGDHDGRVDARTLAPLLAPALDGHDLGLLSEAGMPAVADPGASVVRAAHDLGIAVFVLVGPTSLLLALAASGLNGQNFAFVGYLPQEPTARALRIRQLEALAQKTGQTQLFIETPYRNDVLLKALLSTLQPATRLAVSVGLTLARAQSKSTSVRQWQLERAQCAADTAADPGFNLDNRTPAVFAIGP
ncbi:MAG: SAM-dependent methyltransferase [Variovorax sp.]